MLSQASGSSYLEVLRVEEEPHLLTVLMEIMSTVKPLQTLSEDMTTWLSGSKQGINSHYVATIDLCFKLYIQQLIPTSQKSRSYIMKERVRSLTLLTLTNS